MAPVALHDDDALLTYEDVAAWLQVSESKVWKLVRDTSRPLPIRRIGFQPRIRMGDLRQWIRDTPVVGA